MSLLKISGGTLYDPAHGIDGQVRDVWIENGKVIAAPTDPAVRPDRTLDASGLVVMPGGVDMHCHISGPKVNVARKMLPESKRRAEKMVRTDLARSGTLGSVPSTFATGYKYAGMGYTTAFDAAIPPLAARHALEEFHDTPLLDKGFFVLAGNNHYVLEQIRDGEPERLRNYLGWLVESTKAHTVKVVNPGGVEVWKSGGRNAGGLDEPITHFGVTPRQIVTSVAQAAMDLGLPHPMHLHCNNLGVPGNFQTTLDTMRALEGRRAHVTHIQFHSYGGDPDDQSTFRSRVPELVEYVNGHPNLTVDVGQVMFGDTASMTGDGPLGYFLHKVYGRKWFSADTELEGGCGIVPITYKDKSRVHALQWAIGLEWYLLMDDPWRIAMSTDHPNGGSFLAYPEILSLLMDRRRREEVLAKLPPGVREGCVLGDLTREYTLNEVAIITRAAPARMLGLPHKGHLGPGADADVTIYTPGADLRRMFELPRVVIQRGHIVFEQGELRRAEGGVLLHASPSYDPAAVPHIRDWFERYYTVQFANYPVEEAVVGPHEAVPTGAAGV